MTAAQLLVDLRARDFYVAARGVGVSVTPREKLSFADRQAIKAHRPALLALLKLESLVKAKQLVTEEQRRRDMVPPLPVHTVFHTARGFMELRQLNEVEVRSLAGSGKLTAEEVNTWSLTHGTRRYVPRYSIKEK